MVSDKEIVFEDTKFTIRAFQTSLNANVVAIHPGDNIKNELTIKKKTNLLWKNAEIYKEEIDKGMKIVCQQVSLGLLNN